ncbi:helix-turn-helix domain-containing protein [Nocardiopsis alkaliphila]|uniref:helix-turn-helix domain-containing protein n=1 Tax=Nocardiopsis alkaliphila TaxID=225762 RepID=UPI00034C84DF|nr:helix-turn-helix domain-containing protein [Nocardiopsis alkaliphila]
MLDAHQSPSFGDLLRHHRTRMGFTQQELADFSTISVRAIRDLEHGRARHPRKVTARLLTEALRLNDEDTSLLLECASRPYGHPFGMEGASVALPAPWCSPLVGRGTEAGSLSLLLASPGSRLVTVTGVPGTGRTHFVAEVAQHFHGSSGVPVLWASADEPVAFSFGQQGPSKEVVESAVSLVYGESARDGSEEIFEELGSDPVLLVLNRPRNGPLSQGALADLLRSCPGLRVLTVAPRPHEIPGERVFPLAALEPKMSLKLLIRCSDEVWSTTPANTDDIRHLTRICAVLDHLPGAVVRAATWLSLYDPATLLECLRKDPIPFLCPLSGAEVDLAAELRAESEPANSHERTMLDLLSATPEGEQADGLARIAGLDLAECGRALNALMVRGIVRCDRTTGRARVHLLNLVRALRPLHMESAERGAVEASC